MALQNAVGLNYALGIAGQQVVIGQAEYLAYNPLSDGTVKAGAFCFKKAGSGNGEVFAHAALTGAADAVPLGFVERVVGFVELVDKDAIGSELLADVARKLDIKL